ncbi:germination protein YpeB [Alicyclobacillus curvatus]|jgi:spore germination protein|nr:germination protein YpeB [Alicyclobacillus curvatus]
MHRTTWFAIPIALLAVLCTGLGIWSYKLNTDRQAMVNQSDAQYSAAFHSLVSDMDHLTQRLGESEVSTDQSGFAACAQDIWRLAYAGQTEISKLPVELMPMHHTQAFLTALANQSNAWIADKSSPRDPAVFKQVNNYYQRATSLKTELQSIQGKVLGSGLGWVAVNRSVNQKGGYHTGDNQVVDGFRTLEKDLTTFSETASLGSQLESTKPPVKHPQGAIVTPTTAMNKVAAMLRIERGRDWKTTTSNLGGRETVYLISGNAGHNPISAVVSRAGGNVLSLHEDRNPANGNYGFDNAENRAKAWLQQNGFGIVDAEIANQYGNVGYFVFVPQTAGGLAIQSPITINMALDNGDVLTLDTQAYYRNPVPATAPKRSYSTSQLQRKLNPQLKVEEVRNVVMRNPAGQVTSAAQFIGVHGKQTYSVILDATTGDELSVNQIS